MIPFFFKSIKFKNDDLNNDFRIKFVFLISTMETDVLHLQNIHFLDSLWRGNKNRNVNDIRPSMYNGHL